ERSRRLEPKARTPPWPWRSEPIRLKRAPPLRVSTLEVVRVDGSRESRGAVVVLPKVPPPETSSRLCPKVSELLVASRIGTVGVSVRPPASEYRLPGCVTVWPSKENRASPELPPEPPGPGPADDTSGMTGASVIPTVSPGRELGVLDALPPSPPPPAPVVSGARNSATATAFACSRVVTELMKSLGPSAI